MVFAEYVVNIIAQSAWDPTTPMKRWSNKLIGIACLLVLSGLNSISVSVGTRIQDVFTFMKIVTLLVIGITGVVVLAQKTLSSHNFDHAFEGESQPNLGDIALGLYSGLWAYDGWNNLNYVSSEMKNPTKDLPRVIFAGVPIVIIFYLLANTAYYAVLPAEVVMSTNTVAIVSIIDKGVMLWSNKVQKERVENNLLTLRYLSVRFMQPGLWQADVWKHGRSTLCHLRGMQLLWSRQWIHLYRSSCDLCCSA